MYKFLYLGLKYIKRKYIILCMSEVDRFVFYGRVGYILVEFFIIYNIVFN